MFYNFLFKNWRPKKRSQTQNTQLDLFSVEVLIQEDDIKEETINIKEEAMDTIEDDLNSLDLDPEERIFFRTI